MSIDEPTEPPANDTDVAAARPRVSRRAFIGSLGSAAVGAGALATGLTLSSSDAPTLTSTTYRNASESFYGRGPQGGIVTPTQSSSYFASFDLTTEKRADVVALLRTWCDLAGNLTQGKPAKPFSAETVDVETDSLDAIDLGPARLTLTIGFGTGLFEKDGVDRFGLRSQRPAAFVDLPRFPNDQLVEQTTGGDLTVQACADDPQVAFHAVRELARVSSGVATLRWTQAGFNETPASAGTPRNLMGFKDGTINPSGSQLGAYVWVGNEGPSWMRGGSYAVARRIRISVEHWDSKSLDVQEQVVGRHKLSGAPLGRSGEFATLDLAAKDDQGQYVIPLDAHVRLASRQANYGQMILRRSYAYNDGLSNFTERWPPWQNAMLYDVGLLFVCYQRDPRYGFIAINKNLAENDSLGQFTTHTGSVLVAVPRAASGPGHYVGEELFV